MQSGTGGTNATEGGSDGGATPGTTGSGDCIGERDHAIGLPVDAVAPDATDPEIRSGDPDHLWVAPDPTAAGKLFVFFPGTGGPPIGYREIVKNAAAGGYHAVGLAYVNDDAVKNLCPPGSAPDCQEQVRLEIITGTDTSPVVDVDRPNSIENRLIKLLAHIGWDQYVDGDGELRWQDIAVAGHSQGGGHAGMLAKLHVVHRAVLFAATEPAAWTQADHATADERYFGFVHVDDPEGQFFLQSWGNLGIPGSPVSVDGDQPPFGGSHRLETSDPPPTDNAHGAPVVDPHTPFDGDQPRYRDVWCHLIGP
jgi:hypothetical protein